MKRHLCSLVLTGSLTAGVLIAQQPGSASEPTPQQGAPQANSGGIADHDGGNRGTKLNKCLAHMTKRYKLAADRQTQIKSIIENEQQDAQLVDSDTLMSRGDEREEIASVHEASQHKIAAILTGQQRNKFDADLRKMEKRRAWMDGRLPEPNPGPALNGGW
jgi:Spy/CpxP family protein refolding chaperone